MKKLLTAIAILAATAVGCKKDNTTPAPSNPGGGNNPSEMNVDDVKLTITKINSPVAPHNPGNYSIFITMESGAFYVGNASNSAMPQYFDKYDVATNKFTPSDTTKNLCACGYGSKMIGDGKGSIYYIANDATRYNTSTDTWTWMNFPANANNNHGESGPILHDNKIYYIGGRTASRKVKYFDLSTQTWYNAADFPYATNRVDGVSLNGKIYAFGGENGDQKFSVYSDATKSWSSMPDLPFKTAFWTDRRYVAAMDKFIFVYASDSLQVFDTQTEKWSKNPILARLDFDNRYASIFTWNNTLYIASKSNSNEFVVYEAKMN
jgi:hypothetical protein